MRPAGGSKVKQQLRNAHQKEGEGNFNLASGAPLNYLDALSLSGSQHSWSCIFFVFLSPVYLSFGSMENKSTRGRKRLTDSGYKRRFASDNLMLWGIKCICWEESSVGHELTSGETGYMTKDTLLRRDFHMLKLVFISYSIWHGRLSRYWGS